MRSDLPAGKGIFIWQAKDVLGGDPELIANQARAACFGHVLIKISDGSVPYNSTYRVLAAELEDRGIETWGWGYTYGVNPVNEARVAASAAQSWGCKGFVIDAEVEYKKAGAGAAKAYCDELRNRLPTTPIAISTFRFPSLHRDFPWEPFLRVADFTMPQVYWMKAHNPSEQLERSVGEYRALTKLPIVPTGAAFHQDGWQSSKEETAAFHAAAMKMCLPAVNYWEWANAVRYGLFDNVANLPWGDCKPEPPDDAGLAVKAVVDGLNVRSGPSTSYPIVGHLSRGQEVGVLEVHGDEIWVKISSDPERWVAARHGGIELAELIGKK